MSLATISNRTILVAIIATLTVGCGPPTVELGRVDYSGNPFPANCAPGSKTGASGISNRLETPGGLRVSVRTAQNYDATRAHPLLIVYAAGGHHRYKSESFSGLTTAATGAGFVVAYSDHLNLKLESFKVLGEVPQTVEQQWCIDRTRIYVTGHSDGGLASEALVFLGASTLPIAAFVASGAGIRGEDLNAYSCPNPRTAMIIHSRDDRLFPLPAYGRQAADWWARCNRCQVEQFAMRDDGCIEYSACAGDTQTRYCEIKGSHSKWHGMNNELLQLLLETKFPEASAEAK